MKKFYFYLGIFLTLTLSRFIPHPPNFTSLLALSFYIPAVFGTRNIGIVLISFIITDLFIGFHSTIVFTWGSVLLIGLVAKYFNKSILHRMFGALGGATLFFLVTNFGVWTFGSYGYSLNGLITNYTLALPFFSYSLISTVIFSTIIETFYKFLRLPIEKIKNL